MTRKYTAYYRCTKCGATDSLTISAASDRAAWLKLPIWIHPDNHKMRRNGGIEKESET